MNIDNALFKCDSKTPFTGYPNIFVVPWNLDYVLSVKNEVKITSEFNISNGLQFIAIILRLLVHYSDVCLVHSHE